MGPTNVALVKLFRAEQALRSAQERLDAASKNVRVQERRVNDLSEKQKLAQNALRESLSRAKQLELDMATRNAHIEKLREQQQTTHNNKEYQAYTVEISTQKVDRAKVEEESLKAMEAAETAQSEATSAHALVEAERAKLESMKQQSGEALAGHRADVEALRPARDAAAAALPARARESFERLAEHHDGEAMSALSKPDRRREEYLCTACNMELARDVYNKLHSRDEIVYCPSCRRILYIPDELPPEMAIGVSKPLGKAAGPKKVRVAKGPRPAKTAKAGGAAAAPGSPDGASESYDESDVVIEQRAKGKLGQALSKAQGETVRSSNNAGETPVECEIYVDGKLAGIYKGQTPQNLENAAKFFLGEAGIAGTVEVKPVPKSEPIEEQASPATPATPASPATPDEPTGSSESASIAEATSSPAAAAAPIPATETALVEAAGAVVAEESGGVSGPDSGSSSVESTLVEAEAPPSRA